MDGSGGYLPEWSNPITKELTWYALTNKQILAQKLRIPKIQFAKLMKLKNKEDQSVDTSFLLRRGKNTHGRSYRDKIWSRDWRSDHPETVPPGDPSHKQPPNPGTIAYTNKILLTGPWYICFLWGYASAWQTQKWMHTVSFWMEHRAPSEGAEGVCNPIRGTIWTN